jgi:hypothetical protein
LQPTLLTAKPLVTHVEVTQRAELSSSQSEGPHAARSSHVRCATTIQTVRATEQSQLSALSPVPSWSSSRPSLVASQQSVLALSSTSAPPFSSPSLTHNATQAEMHGGDAVRIHCGADMERGFEWTKEFADGLSWVASLVPAATRATLRALKLRRPPLHVSRMDRQSYCRGVQSYMRVRRGPRPSRRA